MLVAVLLLGYLVPSAMASGAIYTDVSAQAGIGDQLRWPMRTD